MSYKIIGGDGEEYGPVDSAEVHQWVQQGRADGQTMVQHEGTWMPLAQVPEFAPIFSGPPGPPTPGQSMGGQGMPMGGGMSQSMTWNVGTVVFAGFWLRFAAALIDGLILIIPSYFLGFVLGIAVVATGGGPAMLEGLGNLIGLILGWLYNALLESSKYQGSVGKLTVGIKVTDMNGQSISFGNATGRHFGKIVSAMICLIGFIMAGFTEKKQALHDMMAGCLVVRR